jgi:NAD(P)H-dependent FMN reductase
VPASTIRLNQMIESHHGILIVTPEYNASLPPLLKNAIDRVSCVRGPHEARGRAFHARAFAVASASAGRGSGARDVWLSCA